MWFLDLDLHFTARRLRKRSIILCETPTAKPATPVCEALNSTETRKHQAISHKTTTPESFQLKINH